MAARQAEEWQRSIRSIRRALWFIALLLLAGALYAARIFMLPVVLAILFALTLSPLVRFAKRRGVPNIATASILVLTISLTALLGVYVLSGPVGNFIDRAPFIMQELDEKLRPLREPLAHVSRASEQLEEMGGAANEAEVQEVRVRGPGFMVEAADEIATVIGIGLITGVLTLFLLAYNTLIYEKIVQAAPRFTDKKKALRAIHAMETEISQYLLSITVINIGLGIAVGVAMWFLEMPSPYLWGIAAAALNFMPYVGAIIGVGLVGVVALVSVEPLGLAVMVPVIYLILTTLEGQFVTPAAVGTRLSINPLIIVIAVAFWAWLWGFAGILIAVPLLIIARVLADHIPAFAALGHFISTSEISALKDMRSSHKE